MSRIDRVVCAGLVAMALVGPAAQAQRRQARPAQGVPAKPLLPSLDVAPYTGAGVPQLSPRVPIVPQREHRHGPYRQRGSTVVVVPEGSLYYPGAVVAVDAGTGEVQPGYGVSSPGPVSYGGAVPGYTPDFTGTPYVALDGGDMLVDLANGERHRFPACAARAARQDPGGRPRTIFYPQGIDGVVLHEGSRGRVLGVDHADAESCYTTDSFGRMILR